MLVNFDNGLLSTTLFLSNLNTNLNNYNIRKMMFNQKMNRKILPVTLVMLLIAITTICYFKYVEYKDELSLLQAENYNLNDKIKYLNEKTKDLEKEIENLDSKIYELENNNRLY